MAKATKKKVKRDPGIMEVARDLERGESKQISVTMVLTKVSSRCMHSNPDGHILEFEAGDVVGEFPRMPKTKMIVAQG